MGTNLSEAQSEDVLFKDCTGEGMIFASATFKTARFEQCILREATFAEADLTGVVFYQCDLSKADLRGAKLKGADLRGSTLDGMQVGVKELQGAIDGALSWEPPTTSEPPTSIHYPDPEWVGWPGLGVGVFGKQGLPNAVRKVLTFTTPPLREDLEVTGPIVLRLWLASDQLDTGVYVTISDQDPGNLVSRAVSQMLDVGPQAVAVTRGWLKASHRRLDPARSTDYRPFHPHIDPEPPEPGHPTKLMIEVWPTSWVFRRGLRIRLQLAPGDSPAFDPFYHHYNMKQHDE